MWHDVKSETFPISLSCLLNVWTIFRRCLMFLDCGFLCEGHGLYFLLQSKGWDFMHVLECLVFVPLDVSLEMESATHKQLACSMKQKFHRAPLNYETVILMWLASGFTLLIWVINMEKLFFENDLKEGCMNSFIIKKNKLCTLTSH